MLLVAQNPRPTNGRVTLLAYVTGEESFIDSNGNGFFDTGETFKDLPEPFEDDNENGTHDSGEYFFDTNGDQNYSGPDGKFEGYVCDSPGQNCHTTATTIGNFPTAANPNNRMVIAFSNPVPAINPATDIKVDGVVFTGENLALKANEIASVVVVVRDSNGNPMPAGTTFALSISSGGGTVLPPSTICPYNTSDPSPAANAQAFVIQAPAASTDGSGNSGLVSLAVVAPANVCRGALTTTVPLFTVSSP